MPGVTTTFLCLTPTSPFLFLLPGMFFSSLLLKAFPKTRFLKTDARESGCFSEAGGGGKSFEKCLGDFLKVVCRILFFLLTQQELFFADVAEIKRLGLVTWQKGPPNDTTNYLAHKILNCNFEIFNRAKSVFSY